MKLNPHQIYHVYNRGNNKQQIFFNQENYRFFLEKVKLFLVPYCDILAYSLMPNHFHFLIYANEMTNKPYRRINLQSRKKKPKRVVKMSMFSHGLQLLLSSYSKGINVRHNRTGSLFQQNTKCKQTSSDLFLEDYSLCCFIYIHNNPKNAGLVTSPDLYEFSSYADYIHQKEDSICNLPLAKQLLSMDMNDLFEYHNCELSPEITKCLFK